jgi:hypothetical protein
MKNKSFLYVVFATFLSALLTIILFIIISKIIFLPEKIEKVLFYITFFLFYSLILKIFLSRR